MIEVEGNIWDYKCAILCILTNGIVTAGGNLVMGAGVARQCKDRHPEIPQIWGKRVMRYGNKFYLTSNMDKGRLLAIFPTKFHWTKPADKALIRLSAMQLRGLLFSMSTTTIVALPRPGCSNGGLDWSEVKPLIADILPDNVHAINFLGA